MPLEKIILQEEPDWYFKGTWIVSSNKLIRGTVSCVPVGTKFMKSESTLFLQSLMVIK